MIPSMQTKRNMAIATKRILHAVCRDAESGGTVEKNHFFESHGENVSANPVARDILAKPTDTSKPVRRTPLTTCEE